MRNVIRPEARAALWHWREVIAAIAICALGLRGVQSFGIWVWLGWAGLMLGAGLAWTGFQRARFRVRGSGVGVVEVDEWQLRYMGPFGGAEMALDTMMVVALDRRVAPARWVLTNAFGERITIPSAAAGAEALFDAFSVLPGFPMERALAAMAGKGDEVITIWRRSNAAVDTGRISPHG